MVLCHDAVSGARGVSHARSHAKVCALADYINSGSGAAHAASNAVQPPHTRYFAGRGRRLGVIESDEEGRRRTNERTNERTNVAL